jgi:glycosyltransferase involved in cell wall biosynthesis
MNVVFDGQIFSFQDYGGISRYYCELIKQFSAMEGVEPSLIIQYSNSRYLPEIDFIHAKHFFPYRRFKGRNEIIKLLNRNYVRRNYQGQSQPDVFHPTYYDPYFLSLLDDTPFVLTIYDMSHELYPHLFSRFDFTAENKMKVSAKANRIIAISEHTKKDIITLLNIPASKIDVIPLATTFSPDKTSKADISIPDKYFLYVGKRNTYKNFLFLLYAMKDLHQTGSHYSLICAGGGKFSAQEREVIRKLQLSDKIIQMDVDDNVLMRLYSKAQAFVFPSLYEGFGIPILEAFACGCPALLSNRSSLPEVGGNAAIYFDPESISDLSEKLARLIEDKDLTDDMRNNGLNRLKLFSWENTACLTLDTYKKATV